MTTIHHLGQLEQRADMASAALGFTTGCRDCSTLELIIEAILQTVEDLGEGNPPAVLIARTRPELWEEIEAIERAVAELESAVFEVWQHRREPSVN